MPTEPIRSNLLVPHDNQVKDQSSADGSCSLTFTSSKIGEIGSFNWISQTYLPLRDIVWSAMRALNSSDDKKEVVILDAIRVTGGSDDTICFSHLVDELVMIEVANLRLKDSVDETNDGLPAMHEIQRHCIQDFRIVVGAILEILLFHEKFLSLAGESTNDLLEYCVRKVCA
jgi:hypothetical protein